MDDLSRRERDVLAVLCKGRSNDQIAVELGIGRETVKSHLKSIFSKLDVSNRGAAIAIALRDDVARSRIDTPKRPRAVLTWSRH